MSAIAQVFAAHDLDVSHETIEKLECYDALLKKWQKTINLVSASTLPDSARRHFLDSAQLMKFIPDTEITLADLGSGAGFPGMVLAIMGVKDVHLIESDQRKSAFLQTVSRETDTPVTIHARRVEGLTISEINIVTARALTSLDILVEYMATLAPAAQGLFLKGGRAQEEINVLRQKRSDILCQAHASDTSPESYIVSVSRETRSE